MNTLPLEDQLRSMILKNSSGQDAPQTQPGNQFDVKSSPTQTNNPHPAAGSAPLSQRPAPPQDRFQGRLPHDSPQRFHSEGRRGFHNGRGQSNTGQRRQALPSTPASPPGFNQHRQGIDHVPMHMRNRGIPPNYMQQQSELKSVQPSQNSQRFRVESQNRGPPGSSTHFRGSMPPGNHHQILSHQHPRGPMRGPGQPAAQLYDPYPNQRQQFLERQNNHASAQSNYLTQLATSLVPDVAMTDSEFNHKLDFVDRLQGICQAEMSSIPNVPKLEFKCFGSIGTGFVTKGSDIDLAVVAHNEDDTESARKYGPRALEKIFLDNGFGARLLTNTRVPIIKFCEMPSQELLENLRAERQKWDDLPEEEKAAILEGTDKSSEEDAAEGQNDADTTPEASPAPTKISNTQDGNATASKGRNTPQDKSPSEGNRPAIKKDHENTAQSIDRDAKHLDGGQRGSADHAKRDSRQEKLWLREKPIGPLDFPKDGVGILCDLNFAGHLGIYNTRLLHCYAISDQRVRDMVIFVKAWAKKRKINSSYNGTLSSYGYALMVLHYLMRVPSDPVIQDLQIPLNFSNETARPNLTDVVVEGHRVKFCDDEKYIQDVKQKGQWTKNRDSLGALLRGFFSYYGRPGIPDRVGGFHWTRDVITFGQRKPWERMVTKGELGWTRARVEKNSKKEIRHRYLVCIQDPFELDHNVGRTVSHQGIVAIREEFRRAWRILEEVAHGRPHKDIFDSIEDDPPQPQFFGGNNHNNSNSNSQQSEHRDDTNSRQGGPPMARNAAANENGGAARGGSRRSQDPTPAEARVMAQKRGAHASNANNSPAHHQM